MNYVVGPIGSRSLGAGGDLDSHPELDRPFLHLLVYVHPIWLGESKMTQRHYKYFSRFWGAARCDFLLIKCYLKADRDLAGKHGLKRTICADIPASSFKNRNESLCI